MKLCKNIRTEHTTIECAMYKTMPSKKPIALPYFIDNVLLENSVFYDNTDEHFFNWKIYFENVLLHDFGWLGSNQSIIDFGNNSNSQMIYLGENNQLLFDYLENKGYYISNEKISISLAVKDFYGYVSDEIKKINIKK